MEKSTCYYELLGVTKDASSTQIKRAYRKACLLHHPDKNPNNREEAEERFKAVTEAYEVLSEPEKRRRYDMFGKDGENQQRDTSGFYSHFDEFDMFSNFAGKHRNNSGREKRRNYHHNDIFSEVFGMDSMFNSFDSFHSANNHHSSTRQFPSNFMNNHSLFGGSNFFDFGHGENSFFDDFSFGGGMSSGNGNGTCYRSSSTSTINMNGTKISKKSSTYTDSNGKTQTFSETTKRYPDGRVEKTQHGSPLEMNQNRSRLRDY
mmetsp:Transcript_19564/g.28987  ORF Transcript_19564/g.28987 Transcript_19564/m.28987 type:complete len:261 (-) Transcript_19564:85-867(-)